MTLRKVSAIFLVASIVLTALLYQFAPATGLGVTALYKATTLGSMLWILGFALATVSGRIETFWAAIIAGIGAGLAAILLPLGIAPIGAIATIAMIGYFAYVLFKSGVLDLGQHDVRPRIFNREGRTGEYE